MGKFTDGTQFLAGAAVGWVLEPSLWALPPGTWFAAMVATARAESNFNAAAAGDDGTSVGIAQFQAQTWEAVAPAGWSTRYRTSAYLSGRKSAGYAAAALAENPAVWAVLLYLWPGVWPWRALWTGGWGMNWDAARARMDAAQQAESPSGAQRPQLWYWGARVPLLLLDLAYFALLALAFRWAFNTALKAWRK